MQVVWLVLAYGSWFIGEQMHWWPRHWQTFALLSYKTNRFNVTVSLHSNRSQKTSIHGKYFSDTINCASFAICFVFTTFWFHQWYITGQSPVVKRAENTIQQKNCCPADIRDSKTYSIIQWMEIYPVNSITWPSNNQSQMYSNMDGGQKRVLFDSVMWCKNKKTAKGNQIKANIITMDLEFNTTQKLWLQD